MYAEAAAAGGPLAMWSPLLALHACRLRRYLSDDCLSGYGERRRCDLCLAAFPSAWLLERHAALQHAALPAPTTHAHLPHAHVACSLADRDEKPFVCEQCGQSYRYRSAYAKHREQNHRARLPADKLFTCDVCGMQFRYLKSFKKHRLNHALERLHTKTSAVASSGGAGTVSSEASGGEAEPEQDDTVDSYGAPLDVDSESGPSEDRRAREQPVPSVSSVADSSESEATRVPGVAFGSSAAESERQRERERRFACPFCGKCVRSKENLKLHVRKHTGERPFVCLFCGRAFGGKSDLTRHLRIHTGERPYHCEACGKCFARADYLSKHLTTHVHNAR